MAFLRFVLVFLVGATLNTAPQTLPAAAPPALGTVSFSNSCAATAQPPFLTGVALLHSFQYGAAEKAFAEVAHADPACAMAYWGMAMTTYHSLWDGVNDHVLARGRVFIEKARITAPAAGREREYISALSIIFEEGRSSVGDRLARYSKAMAELSRKYPEDGEAAAFYALSLLALPEKENDVATRKEVIAILTRLSTAQPEHPGAVHYLIHAADTPELAPLGLEAARRYARLAPDSSHALHMPSHIFVRLGLWQESIDSNLAAAISAEKATQQQLGEAQYQFHAMDFLDHCYLQRGEESKARQVLAGLGKVPGSTPVLATNVRLNLTSRNLLELHSWNEALMLAPEGDHYFQQVIYALHAIAAARTGDVKTAEESFKQMKKALKNSGKDGKLEDYRRKEAEAWLDFAKGEKDKALQHMRAAADMQEKGDPGGFQVPAREMLADLLLELHRPSEAAAEYEAVLKVIPERFNAIYGAATALEMAGKTGQAAKYYAQLRQTCAPDADRQELRNAKVMAASN